MDYRTAISQRMARTSGIACVLAMGVLVLAGCASQAELPPQATQSLTELRDQLVMGKAQLQTTTNAARDLITRPQAQLEPQITRLVDAITALEKLATNNREQFASAEARAKAYFAHWDQQLATMSESLAEKGQARREQSMASFAELKARAEALRADFRPYLTSLSEVSRYLQTDATASGVKAVTPQIKAAVDREKSMAAKVDSVIAQIDSMRGGK